ncbi:MAG: rRNA cytosine-C5-methyltransferase [Muribaculum sp.]|nr:rRNA cytosine-C5-methyltransferase [Muribaculum sp.]
MRIFPKEFINRTALLLGGDMPRFLQAMQEDPAVSVRTNSRKVRADGSIEIFEGAETCLWHEKCLYLPQRPQFTLDPLLHAGVYYVQDASSCIYGQAMQKVTGLPDTESPLVLDMCAAPGGKTTAMIDALPDNAVMVANEFVGKRHNILRENLAKWGFPNVITTCCDSADYTRVGEIFDVVAVDAPCSGEGMMRKDEEAIRQWSVGLVNQCASLQRYILTNAVKALKPGGILLYSTCTYNSEENEDNARYIQSELGLEPVDLHLAGVPDECRRATDADPINGSLRFMPHITRGEGLFFSSFRKPLSSSSSRTLTPKAKSARNHKSTPKPDPAVAGWLKPGDWTLTADADRILAMSRRTADTAALLADKHFHSRAGVEVAEIKGRDAVPTTELALSDAFRRGSLPEVDLPKDKILDYLRREAIVLPADTPRGFVVLTYQNHPVGVMKNLGNRANNLYPKNWKIRTL